MSRAVALVVASIVLVVALQAAGAEQSLILMRVAAASWSSQPGSGTVIRESWEVEPRILNPHSLAVQLEVTEILPPIPGLGCRPERTPLPPGETSRLLYYGSPEVPVPPVLLLRVRASDKIVVTDELTRVRETCYGAPLCDYRELGRLPLPVFDGTYPTGSTVMAGAVGLGSKVDPITRRRLNITLANYGEAAATFRITIHPLLTAPGNAITSFDQVVPARDVLQLNDVRFDWGNAPTGENSSDKIWVSVTADQPYLFYVSTVLVQQDPGTMPFEVLKPTLLPGPLP